MRITALYDIHGNLPALEAVLEEIQALNIDRILVGGDVVAGPMPNECLNLLRNTSIPVDYIYGNAESEALRAIAGEKPTALSEQGAAISRWVAGVLTPENRDFISTWPLTHEVALDGIGKVLFCHATPDSDTRIFTRRTAAEDLGRIFAGVDADLVVCGHTHMQYDFDIDGLRVVKAGSVGMPFGKTGADWLLIGEDVEFRHTAYDLEAAAERIRQSGYPQADDFAANNVLSSPSLDDALDMLSKL